MSPMADALTVGSFAAIVVCFVFYDQLLKRQYNCARSAWESDGRPPGFFWAGEGTSVFRSWARDWAMTRWLFTTPSWLVGLAIFVFLAVTELH